MTLLLIAGVWMLAACLAAACLSVTARAIRRRTHVAAPQAPVQVPLPRAASTEVRRLESQR